MSAEWDFTSREAQILAEIPQLLSPLRPQRIVLFGSRATGAAEKDSDFDLLVVMDLVEGASSRTLPVRQLLRSLRVPFDIIVYTPEEWEAFRRHPQAFAHNIDHHGKVLLGAA